MNYPQQTPIEIIISSIGFILVAFLTTITGYTLSRTQLPPTQELINDLIFMLVYISLLSPYYLSRQALLERYINNPAERYDRSARSLGVEIPIIVFILITFIAILVLTLFYNFPDYYTIGKWQDIIFSLILGLTPFLLLARSHIRDLKSDDFNKAFRFLERILIPAFATCIVPLSFGWSIVGDSINLTGVFWGSVYVILLLIIPEQLKVHKFISIIIIFLIILFFSVLTRIEVLNVIVYGTLITLAMAVSEASKRVYAAKKDDRTFPEDERLDYYLAGSNWGAIVFPLLLCLVPLLIEELPAWPLLLFISLQSLSWLFADSNFKSSIGARLLGLLFGYSLPLIIILIQLLELPITIINGDSTTTPFQIAALPAIIISFGSLLFFVALKITDDFQKYLFRATKLDTYLNWKNNYFLFLITLSSLIIMVLIIGSISTVDFIRVKAYEIIIFASILLVIVGIFFYIKLVREKPPTSERNDFETKNKNKNQSIIATLRLVAITSRPTTSFVAGLSTFVILLKDHNYPFTIDVLYSMPIILVTMVGFILNDVYDFRKDSKAHVDRPIANKILDRRTAIAYAVFIAIVTIIIVLVFNSFISSIVIMTTLVGVLIYSPLSRKLPVTKGFATTLLCLSPTFYACSLVKIQLPIFIPLSISIFIIGRELLLDTKDVNKDLLSGIKTIVAYLGITNSRILSWILMFTGVLYFLLNLADVYGLLFALLGLISLILSLLSDRKNQVPNGGMTKLTMIFCLLAIPFGI